ncbi:MAG: helix-turn-helix transcriptional regulator [Candidatus Poribacteria bacterium]|nr:helix-turn-helix transcriptional regulator [Candidatus Poribacteria bacterium]MDE0505471.1 helix-turn-helix transcriptional regulator [Candidatus Poribacteria bacterium]
MSNKIRVEEGSGNIFKDLGFSDDVAKDELLRAQPGVEIQCILKERELTQTEAANLLGVKRTEISRLNDAKLSDYSVERLLRFLECLNCEVSIHICAPGYDTARVIAV